MKNDLFERMPIWQAVLQLGLPTLAGMMLTVLYNMADMIFVGMTGSAQQLAAVMLLSPISMITMSIGSIFGVGGASCVSRQLGTRRRREASGTSAFCIYSTLCVSLLTATAGLLLLPQILRALGAAQTVLPLAENCAKLLLWGAAPASLTFTMNQLVRAKGMAKESMIGMALGAAVNLITDPIFILGLGMGVQGSAAASLAADLVSVIYFIRLILRDDVLSLRLRDLAFSRCVISGVLAVGFPTCLTHFILCGSNILFNRLALQYGDHAVAAFGVASRALMLPVMISMGLAKGSQPLIGYNYASGNLCRMHSAIRTAGIMGTVLCLVFSALIHWKSGALIQIFTDDPDVVWLAMVILNVCLTAMPVSALEAVLLTTFQAVGNAGVLLALSVGRQLFLYIPLMLAADHFLGLAGLIWLDPVKEYLSTFLAWLFYMFTIRRSTPAPKKSSRQ